MSGTTAASVGPLFQTQIISTQSGAPWISDNESDGDGLTIDDNFIAELNQVEQVALQSTQSQETGDTNTSRLQASSIAQRTTGSDVITIEDDEYEMIYDK